MGIKITIYVCYNINMPLCIIVTVLCLSFISAQFSCNEWIKDNDDFTYESLKQALEAKAGIPVKEY